MENLNSQIEAVIREAVTKATDIHKHHIANALGWKSDAPAALNGATNGASHASSKVSAKPAKKAAKAAAKTAAKAAKAAKPAKSAKVKASDAAKGVKRDPKVLDALVETLHKHITKHAGQTIEMISAALDKPSKELTLPMKKLIKAGRVGFEGQKRGTKYFPKS